MKLFHWAEFEPFAFPGELPGAMPVVKALVKLGNGRRKALALFDSGSGVSLLPRHLASVLKCMPDSFDLRIRTPKGSFLAGDVLLRCSLLTDSQILQLPLSPFLVPEPGVELPFVVLGHEPLFEFAEVRFRSWEGRVGLSPRLPRRWGTPLNGIVKPKRSGRSTASGQV
jgi:hypothetical protein